MSKQNSPNIIHYIQTPRRISSPIKVDVTLRQRIKEFLASREGLL